MNGPLKTILVGLGSRGRLWGETIRRHDAFEVAWVVDVDTLARSAAVAAHGIAPDSAYASLDEALETVRPDAAVIVSPEVHHADHVSACLERGVPVLVDKPLALDVESSLRLVELAESRGLPLVVGQNYRYMRLHRTIRSLVREGRLGDVGMVVAQYYRPDHPTSTGLSGLDDRILWGMAIHHVDALRWVLGRDVTRVSARTFNLPWGRGRHGASVQAMLSFEGGVEANYVASYESTGHEYFEGGQEFYQRIVGSRGTLHAFHRWLVLCEAGRLPRIIGRGRRERTEEHVLLDQFEGAINRDEPSDCSGRDNLGTVAVMEAIVRSARDGSSIDPRTLIEERRQGR